MRIITGSAKGQTIEVPNKNIRPAQDMVRQAIFSILQGLVTEAKVLDLFAGSGSFGLEALSRGAEEVVFVDNDQKSIRAIKINLKKMGFEDKGDVIKSDAMSFVEAFGSEELPKTFDLIFLSPPYKMGAQIHLLKQLAKILTPQGVILFDHAKETEVPDKIKDLEKIRYRTYGATGISILAKTGKS